MKGEKKAHKCCKSSQSPTTDLCPASPWAAAPLEKAASSLLPIMTVYRRECFLGQLLQLCQPCAPPAFSPPTAPSLLGQCKEQRQPWQHVSFAQQELKRVCYQGCFSHNVKHSTMWTAEKEINSIPTKASAGTCINYCITEYSCFLAAKIVGLVTFTYPLKASFVWLQSFFTEGLSQDEGIELIPFFRKSEVSFFIISSCSFFYNAVTW